MAKLKLNLPSNDTAFLAVVLGHLAALTTLALFQSVPDKVPTIEMLKTAIDRFRQYLEGSKYGDRIQIALRVKARKEVTEMLQKIFHFLESVADEDDLVVLQQAGFELRKPYGRKKTSRKNVLALTDAGQQGVIIAGGATGG